jgi:hypothetical protein
VKKIGNMMRIITILLCFSSVWLSAKDVNVTLQASKTELTVGEKFTVTLKSNTKGSGSIELPDGLEVLASMSGSSSQSINGKQSFEATQTYTLVANRTGSYTIPAATWKYGLGKKAKSNSLTINVKAGSGNSSSTPQNVPQPAANGKNFAIFSANKKEVFVGEPFVISGRIYFDGHIVDANSIKLYDNDLMIHKTDVAGNNGALNVTGEQYNGRMYESILLFEELIVPQQAGKLNFDAFSINVGYQKGFFGKAFKNLVSNQLQIMVNPLPGEAPMGFNGAIGKFTIKSSHDIQNTLNAGDVFTLKVRIEGSGNIHMLKPLSLNLPKGLILYGDPIVDNQVFTTKKGAHGHIDYEFIIQVQHGGAYDFLPFEFAYFNPETKTYQRLDVPKLNFTALGDELSFENAENLENTSQTSDSSWWLTGLLLVLASGVIGIGVVYFLKKNKLNTQSSKTKKPKVDARAVAMNSLETVPTKDLKETADALEKIILQYFRDLTQNDELLLDNDWFNNAKQNDLLTLEKAHAWSQHFANIQALKYAGFGGENADGLVRKTRELVG